MCRDDGMSLLAMALTVHSVGIYHIFGIYHFPARFASDPNSETGFGILVKNRIK